jgi:hypothetical protein
LFYAVGSGFAVLRKVTPDVKDIFFLQEASARTRSSSEVTQTVGQAPVLLHRLNFTANLCNVD